MKKTKSIWVVFRLVLFHARMSSLWRIYCICDEQIVRTKAHFSRFPLSRPQWTLWAKACAVCCPNSCPWSKCVNGSRSCWNQIAGNFSSLFLALHLASTNFGFHFVHSNRLYFHFCLSDGVCYPTLISKVNVCVRLATNDSPFGRFIGWSICAHTTERYPTCRSHRDYETTVTASTDPNMHRTEYQRCGTAWATIRH